MGLIDGASCAFFKMITGFNDLGSIKDGGAGRFGELRDNDLTFLDSTSAGDDGFIYLVKVAGEENSIYCRLYREGDTYTLRLPTGGAIHGVFPVEDVTIKGKVVGIYRELPALDYGSESEHAALIDKLSKVDVGRYDMTEDDARAIRAARDGDTFGCMYYAFKLGLIKGQRSEKARAKKKRQGQGKV